MTDPDGYSGTQCGAGLGISIPASILQRADVLWISLAALLMTLLATIYPALRAAATAPAEALRYE